MSRQISRKRYPSLAIQRAATTTVHNVAKQFGEANNVKVICKAMDRSEYKQWLSNRWTSGIVPNYHTTSPATFFGDAVDAQEDTKFIGGCDDLRLCKETTSVESSGKRWRDCSIL